MAGLNLSPSAVKAAQEKGLLTPDTLAKRVEGKDCLTVFEWEGMSVEIAMDSEEQLDAVILTRNSNPKVTEQHGWKRVVTLRLRGDRSALMTALRDGRDDPVDTIKKVEGL